MERAATHDETSFSGEEKRWPAKTVERRAVSALVPYARNARTHSLEQVDQIAASIREWGWTVPILVDEAGESSQVMGVYWLRGNWGLMLSP